MHFQCIVVQCKQISAPKSCFQRAFARTMLQLDLDLDA